MSQTTSMPTRGTRIAKNTVMLYLRQLLILFVSLYTVRIVLKELGVEGFGIYSAVTGLIALGSFLPGSLAQSTQRFFSFVMGLQDEEKLRKIFTVNLVLYVLVAFFALIFLKGFGIWFLDNHLSIPVDRVGAARNLYLYAVVTFVLSVLTTPFIAIIMAHEDMKLYAYISILEAFMKLGVVLALQFFPWDKLELYGLLLLVVGGVNFIVYIGVCLHRYNECQLKIMYWDFALLKEIVGFTGWTVFGQISTVARTHAITILLNQLFNPVVVAARALSVQVAGQVNIFSANFNASLSPPIVKSYAANDFEGMYSLIIGGSKITFFLLWIFALPMIIEMDVILHVWLDTVPDEAVLFSQLALIETLIFSVSMPLAAAARAPGKMKVYELTLGSIQIAIFMIAWGILASGMPAYSVFIVAIVANVLMLIIRAFLVKQLTGFPVSSFLKSVILPVITIVILSVLPVLLLHELLTEGILKSFLMMLTGSIFSAISMYFIGLDEIWRRRVVLAIYSRIAQWRAA